MHQETREIESITFGIFSAEEILNISVCKVDNPKKNVDFSHDKRVSQSENDSQQKNKKNSSLGTVYDPRMGTTDSSIKCETCKENAIICPGHFGHIELNEPIVHPQYYKRVCAFLSCFCMKCYRLILQKDQILIAGFQKFKGEARFTQILEKLKKVDICCQKDEYDEICGQEQPKIKFNSSDFTYSKIYMDGKNKTSVMIDTDEIKKVFDNILDEDVVTLGFNPELVHPRNFIISVLPVLPPCNRPYVKVDNKICDDDLTIQYIEIIKANNNLLGNTTKKNDQNETTRQKALASLRFRISTTMNNDQGKARHTTNGRSIKGIKERLTGKEGQIRNNMMGKRCDYTARTVIGPDATLRMGELGVPSCIANILTVPVCVTNFNIHILQKMVDNGLVNFLCKPDNKTIIDLQRFKRGTKLVYGDVIYRGTERIIVKDGRELVEEGDKVERNGEILTKLKPSNRKYNLSLGWIVNRPLQDDDYVLLNRQPTLHMASMLAMKVKIHKYKTLRMNLAITKPFNADFDVHRRLLN